MKPGPCFTDTAGDDMALPPGYLALYDAIVQCTDREITREECIDIDSALTNLGWAIVPLWAIERRENE